MLMQSAPQVGTWPNDVSGRAITAEEISDVVAWLESQRPQFPGQPYPDGAAGGSPASLPSGRF
jgi:cytochrome c oxidase cbb3-type subunit III